VCESIFKCNSYDSYRPNIFNENMALELRCPINVKFTLDLKDVIWKNANYP
jgi:hypothetical protein